MSRDKDEFAGAGRLTRAIGVTLSADVDPPPRLLGPLAETPNPIFSQITFPVVAVPDPDEERNERLVELIEELGLDEALKALQRKAPGRKPDDEIDRYLDPFIKALEASGGSLNRARKKFERFTELSPDWARKKFTEILRVVKIKSGGKY
jgi:hypothetical protein